MNSFFTRSAVVFFFLALSACSSYLPSNSQNATTEQKPLSLAEATAGTQTIGDIGGPIAAGMSEDDKTKLSRALDKGTGKETTWTNLGSGINYSMLPIRKVVINGNSLCRNYVVTANRNGNNQQYNGTACITADGGWHEVRS